MNQITIIYNIKKNRDKIKLFGDEFVYNNKNNCFLLIDNKQYKLCEFFKLNIEQNIKTH